MYQLKKGIKRFFTFCTIGLLAIQTEAQTNRIDPPIMGWSSWNTYRVNINDSLICKQADAMVAQGLKEAGYTFINIDDGFFGFRDERGILHTHPQRFPKGVKPVCDYIHSLGLKAGIYSEAGANTCGSIWDKDTNGIGVGLYGFEHQDADLFFNQWGFDFIKIDYCGAGQQLELDEQERYTTIVNAIRSVSNKNISVNVCRWAYPGTWVKDLARSWRISADITPHWESVKYIISKNLYLSGFAGNGHYNDMDMLEIGRGMKPHEDETHFGMWCIMSSPLLIGCDLTSLSEKTLKLLTNRELIAINQDALGLQAHVVQHENGGYVLVKDIEKLHGTVRAVALYNPTDQPCDYIVPLSTLDLQGKTKVRDLIRCKQEKTVKDSLHYTVQPHGIRILKLEAEKRTERTIYEAEHAYLNDYDDLAKRTRSVTFMPCETASGKVVITHLGGHKKNYAEWNQVYSEKGGLYTLTLYYYPSDTSKSKVGNREVNDRIFEVTVNGNLIILKGLESKTGQRYSIDIPVELHKGYNEIKIGSRYTWTPDLDCFTLQKN